MDHAMAECAGVPRSPGMSARPIDGHVLLRRVGCGTLLRSPTGQPLSSQDLGHRGRPAARRESRAGSHREADGPGPKQRDSDMRPGGGHVLSTEVASQFAPIGPVEPPSRAPVRPPSAARGRTRRWNRGPQSTHPAAAAWQFPTCALAPTNVATGSTDRGLSFSLASDVRGRGATGHWGHAQPTPLHFEKARLHHRRFRVGPGRRWWVRRLRPHDGAAPVQPRRLDPAANGGAALRRQLYAFHFSATDQPAAHLDGAGHHARRPARRGRHHRR
jgi:hypothetical protein